VLAIDPWRAVGTVCVDKDRGTPGDKTGVASTSPQSEVT
jgi:hypothetical protein